MSKKELDRYEKSDNKKVPVRTTICPKCLVYGAKLDYRNTNRIVVSSDLLDQFGKPIKKLITLEHTIRCPACGDITRKVR